MGEWAPDLHMLNVIVRDRAARIEFYRRLGVGLLGRQMRGIGDGRQMMRIREVGWVRLVDRLLAA